MQKVDIMKWHILASVGLNAFRAFSTASFTRSLLMTLYSPKTCSVAGFTVLIVELDCDAA
jgi:hypothetical protein